jgi:peptide methionine sulfoxide reductase msrA/msrB
MFEKLLMASILILPLMTVEAGAGTMGHLEKATFAGGCFWCMTPPFEKLSGVTSVVSGYTGGSGPNPTYGDYAAKGHIEAVQITYDPSRISYPALLDVFWRQIDPTDGGGQFCDRGPQYRSAIFYENAEQKRVAEESKEALGKTGRFQKPIATELIKASVFYPAEEYHQDYYRKNPIRYKFYRTGCGRDRTLEKVWGKEATMHSAPGEGTRSAFVMPSREALKKSLTPLQYNVTQQEGTEPPFNNAYWDNHRDGIYVDIVSGEPLFSSLDKYDSGTGWPSFSRPLEPGNIVTREDRSWYLAVRTEVRSRLANSHLGHVFNDGPAPTGLRYCMNSAALRFIPKEDLVKDGYANYAGLFKQH